MGYGSACFSRLKKRLTKSQIENILINEVTMSWSACRCGCGFDTLNPVLKKWVESNRLESLVNSACRCEAHNRAVGGVVNSDHIHGMAVDLQISVLEFNSFLIFPLNSENFFV